MKRRGLGNLGFLMIFVGYSANVNSSTVIAKEFLAAHNSYRAKIGTPPLAWSEKLASRAQEWAATLIARGTYMPRRDGTYGENLFEISGGRATPSNVVEAWASEETNYNHQTNRCTARCGHYTQVIWRSTKLVGCGVARNNRREVWVCNYDPPGNFIGERPY
jgi:pathogenesis-related protein 1